MPEEPAVVIIGEATSEREAIAASLRECTQPRFDVLEARSPTDALRDPRFRDARLVLFECATLPMGAQVLRGLFPRALVVALAAPGCEGIVETEMGAGASDYLLRDEGGAYLRLLPLKAARLLESRPEQPPQPEGGGDPVESIQRLEDNLRRSEIRFGQLVHAIPDIVYHLDPDGNFVFVNASIATLDYAPEDLIGRHFSVVVHPDDLPFVSRSHAIRRYREGTLDSSTAPRLFDERRSGDRRTRNLVVRLMTKPGSPSGVSHKLGDVVSYGVIEAMGHYEEGSRRGQERRDPDSFRGTVGIVHDITLHRRSEEMIRVLLQAVDQSPVAIAVMDSTGTVEYVNPLFLRDSGLRPEQVIGRNAANLTEQPSLRSFFSQLADTAARGTEWRGRLPDAGKPDGPPWEVLYVSPVRDPLGRTSHFIAVLTGGDAAS